MTNNKMTNNEKVESAGFVWRLSADGSMIQPFFCPSGSFLFLTNLFWQNKRFCRLAAKFFARPMTKTLC